MALGKIFELVGDTIIPKEDCLLMEPIRALKDEYPQDYLKIIAFLHYMKSMNPNDNPYADVPLFKRAETILFNLKLNIDPESQSIKDALQCVEEIYFTTFYGLYRGFKAAMDKIGEALLTEEIDFKKDGNATIIKGYMKDYEAMRKSFKAAFQDFEDEQSDGRARGGATLADDENEDY